MNRTWRGIVLRKHEKARVILDVETQAILNLIVAKTERNRVLFQTHLLIELQYHM